MLSWKFSGCSSRIPGGSYVSTVVWMIGNGFERFNRILGWSLRGSKGWDFSRNARGG